ncbi:hypothetical protein RJ55_00743 [Drechmeria coniospora]|nr:hypothetical protein RJ55_00743 [Drechmeria coniospora]
MDGTLSLYRPAKRTKRDASWDVDNTIHQSSENGRQHAKSLPSSSCPDFAQGSTALHAHDPRQEHHQQEPRYQQGPEHAGVLVMASTPTPESQNRSWLLARSGMHHDSWMWPASPQMPPHPPIVLTLQPSLPADGLPVGVSADVPESTVLPPSSSQAPSLPHSGVTAVDVDPSASPSSGSLIYPHSQKHPHHLLEETDISGANDFHRFPTTHQPPRWPAGRNILLSPFKDCVGNFGQNHNHRFNRPSDGKVNGYIKFNWPKQRPSAPSSLDRPLPGAISSDGVKSAVPFFKPRTRSKFMTKFEFNLNNSSTATSSTATKMIAPDVEHPDEDYTALLHGPVSSEISAVSGVQYGPDLPEAKPNQMVTIGAPQKVPELFGLDAKMDAVDRRFWMFYIRNWCPGRSVLEETNLWLKDFAAMHKSDGVRAAVQSLAGIYIYDYQPTDTVRTRVNERFHEAESRLTCLLEDPMTGRDEAQANELITIAAILSMQDIVLTERRLRKPHNPRWLLGFKQGEAFLHATDKGLRFWNRSNAQISSLRVSQSIIVGRAVILAQPMMMLPPPHEFNPEQEVSRFGWLLYGTEQDMYQIHGGCGFSKKLLHIISQITYCAARLQQDPENIIVPMTTQYLLDELLQMRQGTYEVNHWDNSELPESFMLWGSAKAGPTVLEWVRSAPDDYELESSVEMTYVTAEAWRLTVIIYLKCRVLRLPRNHPDVVENLSDLAKCIRIMPTSGYIFTAQAPLFPVFLLGMLATKWEHKQVSKTWFDEVISTPVRSSVPPLYEVLGRIWQWIDTEIDQPPLPTSVDAQPIGKRHAWWEQLVENVNNREDEVLCLT